METSRDGAPFPQPLLTRGPEPDRLRRRCAAIAAAVAFVSCLLVALGLALLALVLLGALAVLAAAFVVHRRGWDVAALDRIEALSQRETRPQPVAADPEPEYGWPSRISLTTSDDADATAETAAVAPPALVPVPTPKRTPRTATLSRLLSALEQRARATLAAASAPRASSPSTLEEEGSRCNALGVELRRAGRVQQAATLHEAARMIYGEVGDSRGEALAANALGVALAEMGHEDAALEQFEQARTLLRELGDRQLEGKVLANVGFAKRRAGSEDEAVDLLRSALSKLSPESEAYHRVERRLRRAS